MTAFSDRMLIVAQKISSEGPDAVTPVAGYDLAEAFILLYRENVQKALYIDNAKQQACELARVMCL